MARRRPAPASPLQPIFDEPVFGEGVASPDPSHFSTRHPSDSAQYKAIDDLLRKAVVSFDKSRAKPGDVYSLAEALGPHGAGVVQQIARNGQIVFHAVGCSGSSTLRTYRDEIQVFDQAAADVHSSSAGDRPAFFFHLGDVVYSFGESKYYFDQFYEPNRDYPGPIFAIPGNHDSFIIPGTSPPEDPLVTFSRNFCSEHPVVTPEAGALHRTSMTEPGVYFTLDAPFVRIIGLFSNALEDPGVISSEGGKWKAVPDFQLAYLEAQLQNIVDENYQGAVLLAVHHPPFTYSKLATSRSTGGNHSSNPDMLRQIDALCKAKGVYPHAFLSAHSHNYQRYTRTVNLNGKNLDVPFVVCGSGGHNLTPIARAGRGEPANPPQFGSDVSYLEKDPAVDARGLILEKYNDRDFGYLRITADPKQLRIGFHVAQAGTLPQSRFDMVTVDLASHTMVSN